MFERIVEFVAYVCMGGLLSITLAPAPALADIDVETPSGTRVTRIKTADDAEVVRAQGRREFLSAYGQALMTPTFSSQCQPQVEDKGERVYVTTVCTHAFFDPNRLKVDAGLLRGPTTWTDVVNNLVGTTGTVLTAITAQAPVAALAYGIHEVGKRSGDKTTRIDGSYNDGSYNDRHDLTRGDTDNRTGTGETGAVVGAGQVGDSAVADPTIVPGPRPEVVNPVIVQAPPPIIVRPEVVTGFAAPPDAP